MIFNENIGMKFCLENFAMVKMKSVKQYMKERIELPNQEKVKTFGGKEIYKYVESRDSSTCGEEFFFKTPLENLKTTRNPIE